MEISSDDIRLVEQFHDILNRGYFCDSKQVSDEYNKLIRIPQGLTPVNVTNCATCLRRRILELVDFVSKIKENSKNENAEKN